ncbi:MAG: hypothetical protein QM289_06450 [Bacillota bacterium]|jgi:glutamate-1-semialdehyde aminotransferase|nr:hypothetical protein [Bacillota bacterium]NLM09095.1 hypothetical protein [Clostridiales Family XIII bacterium]
MSQHSKGILFDIMKLYDPREKKMYHSGTFNGNAVTMAAGVATMTA